MNLLRDICAQSKSGKVVALPSVCSATPDVIRAALYNAKARNAPIIIEATSNQVNQFGGYTGMTPADFFEYVQTLVKEVGIDPELLVFGGDHLGPQVWRALPVDEAMQNAADMMRDYVKAGFTKIHLDCSQGCEGEPEQVSLEISAKRAAFLASVCEAHAPDPSTLSYIIGTEVPPPGGARMGEHGIIPSDVKTTKQVIVEHKASFDALGLGDAWERVIGLVVQPGLEFGSSEIWHFDCYSPHGLADAIEDTPRIIFEAHSTDYQHQKVFAELARRQFALLKVGPALSFAYREAIFALSHIDVWANQTQHISEVMNGYMSAEPKYLKNFYDETSSEFPVLKHFAYTDRIRYYWPQAKNELDEICARIDKGEFMETLVTQYVPKNIMDKSGEFTGLPLSKRIIFAWIAVALDPYFV